MAVIQMILIGLAAYAGVALILAWLGFGRPNPTLMAVLVAAFTVMGMVMAAAIRRRRRRNRV